MDKISPVSTNLLYAYKPQASVPVESKNNSDATTVSPDIVKKETADAAKAYAIVAPKEKAVPEKKSIDELKAEVSSSGDCKIKGIDCQGDVLASAGSSGDIVLEGVCRNAAFESGSAGDVRADRLRAVDVTASSSSAGDITCSASGTLDVHVSSAGSVSYAGTPARITGDVKKASRM